MTKQTMTKTARTLLRVELALVAIQVITLVCSFALPGRAGGVCAFAVVMLNVATIIVYRAYRLERRTQ